MLLDIVIHFKKCQRRQHPPRGDAGLVDQIVYLDGVFIRKHPHQGDLVIRQFCLLAGQAHRRRHRFGFFLLPRLIAQGLRQFPRAFPVQLVRKAGFIFLQDIPRIGDQDRSIPNQRQWDQGSQIRLAPVRWRSPP